MKKKFWPKFSRSIEHKKCHGTIKKGLQSFLQIIVQKMGSLLWDLRGQKEQIFQNIAVFTMIKVLGPFFLVWSSVIKNQGIFYRGPQTILITILEVIREFFWDLRGCWKHKILKNKRQTFSGEEKFPPSFSFFIEHKNVKEQIKMVHKVFFCKVLCKR